MLKVCFVETCSPEELGVSETSRKPNEFCFRKVGCAVKFRAKKIIVGSFKYCIRKVNIFYMIFYKYNQLTSSADIKESPRAVKKRKTYDQNKSN